MNCQLEDWQLISSMIVAQMGYMGLEAWLGSTKKVEAGSILELIYNKLIKPKGNP